MAKFKKGDIIRNRKATKYFKVLSHEKGLDIYELGQLLNTTKSLSHCYLIDRDYFKVVDKTMYILYGG